MNISLPPQLESVLIAQARQRGMSPEAMALDVLCRQLLPMKPPEPIDHWETELFKAAVDCGTAVPNEAFSSDGLYE